MSTRANFTWKIVIGGMGAVGKTTFIHRYLTGQYIEGTAMTVGVEFHNHIIEHDGKKIDLVIWDLGGQERFRYIQSKFIEGSAAALVLFDMSRIKTLHETTDWIDIIRKNTSPSIPILLIGAKADLVEGEFLKFIVEDAHTIVKELNLTGFIATSSKLGQNVEESMHKVVSILLEQMKR